MFGAASRLVMTLGAMTSWALTTDAHSRNRAANLMMLLAPVLSGKALRWPWPTRAHFGASKVFKKETLGEADRLRSSAVVYFGVQPEEALQRSPDGTLYVRTVKDC